jgi:hypothetical protein
VQRRGKTCIKVVLPRDTAAARYCRYASDLLLLHVQLDITKYRPEEGESFGKVNFLTHPDLPPALLAARPHSNSLTLPFFSTFSFVTMLFWSTSATCIRSPSRMSTLSLSSRGHAHLFVTLPSGSKNVQSVVVTVTLQKRNRSLSNRSV